MKSLKTISMNCFKIHTANREFSLYGGLLYLDGTPVQSYFSKNMFYWEAEKERGALYLYHHGLMAQVVLQKDGVREIHNASTEQHYTISYRQQGKSADAVVEVCFGICFDTSQRSHYYCGVIYNGKEIICVPKTDREKINQRIMSVDVTKQGLLHIVIDSSGYKDMTAGFPISQLDMVFDATYNTCNTTVTEGEIKVEQCQANLDLWEMQQVSPTLKGKLRMKYNSKFDLGERTITITVDSLKKNGGDHYYGSVDYGQTQIVAIPSTDEEKLAQDIFSCGILAGKWKLSAKGLSSFESGCYADSLTVWEDSLRPAFVYEKVSQIVNYSATGHIRLPQALQNRDRRFCVDKLAVARLKENCLANGFDTAPLSVDDLFTLSAPPQMQIEDPDNPGQYLTVDGQQHVHQKSTELLSCLAAYYTAGVESSDKQLTYADLYGYTKDYAKTQIIQVSPAIITEIEAEVDEKGRKYVVEFLKMFSDIILSSSYASSSNKYIQKGFAKVTKPVERCQYYMANNHPGAMQHEKGYQVAMSIIDRYVYMSLVPRLKDYYGEQSEQWAEDLYYAALDRLVMLQLQTIGGSNRGTHLAKMLSILDSRKHVLRQSQHGDPVKDDDGKDVEMPYGAALYAQLFNMSLSEVGNSFQGPDSEANFFKIMEIVFGDLYDKITGGQPSDIPEDVFKELQKILEIDRDIFIVDQLCQLEEYLNFSMLTADLVSSIVKYGAATNVFGKITFCAMYAMIGASFSSVFTQWDSLTDAEKAEGILSCIFCIVGVAREAVTWRSVSQLVDPSTPPDVRTQAAYRLKYGGTDLEAIKNVIPQDPANPYDLSQRLNSASKQYSLEIHDPSGVKVKLSFCSKVFVCLEISFRVMNVLLLGYAFIMSTLSLAELFKYDYSEALRAVSVINTILLAVSFVLELADMGIRFGIITASAQIASVIPGVGLGIMLLAFVFTIAELILKKDEVKPPIQLIIEEHLAKTVAALPEPPSDWEQANLALA